MQWITFAWQWSEEITWWLLTVSPWIFLLKNSKKGEDWLKYERTHSVSSSMLRQAKYQESLEPCDKRVWNKWRWFEQAGHTFEQYVSLSMISSLTLRSFRSFGSKVTIVSFYETFLRGYTCKCGLLPTRLPSRFTIIWQTMESGLGGTTLATCNRPVIYFLLLFQSRS